MGVKLNKQSFLSIGNILIALYTLLLLIDIFSRSTFSFGIELLHIRFIPIGLMLLLSIFGENHSKWEWIILILGVVVTFRSINKDYLFMILIIFSSRSISPKLFIKTSLVVIIVSLTIILLAAKLGIIPNLLNLRNGIVRQGLGFQYPLIFSGYIFLGFVCYILLDQGKHPIFSFVVAVFVVLALNKLTNSRNDEICIILVALINCAKKYLFVLMNKFTSIVIDISVIIILFSVFINKFIPTNSNLGAKLDILFSGRLSLQTTLFQYYSPSLFSQNIIQNGWGGKYTTATNYFYIDNSFTRLFFMGGMIFFGIIFVLIVCKMLQLSKAKLSFIALILLIICINGISSDSFSILTTNLLLPLFGISLTNYKNDFVTDVDYRIQNEASNYGIEAF